MNQTLFEKISSSPDAMAEFLSERAVLSTCVLVCGGKCVAMDNFVKTGHEICKEKILSYLNRNIGGDGVE